MGTPKRSNSIDDVNRDTCRWSDKGSYIEGFPGQREVSRLQQCERHMSVALVEDDIERCAMVRSA